MRVFATTLVLAALACPLAGTTLQQLTLDEMAQKSTQIVRGKAQISSSALRGSMIYTHYKVLVTEQWKGNSVSQVDVAVPGGTVNGRRQAFAGTPVFADGQEYIFFLWTSRTGLTQIIGLSQGKFDVQPGAAGALMVSRAPASDRLLDASGKEVTDSSLAMTLTDFKEKVSKLLAPRAGK